MLAQILHREPSRGERTGGGESHYFALAFLCKSQVAVLFVKEGVMVGVDVCEVVGTFAHGLLITMPKE